MASHNANHQPFTATFGSQNARLFSSQTKADANSDVTTASSTGAEGTDQSIFTSAEYFKEVQQTDTDKYEYSGLPIETQDSQSLSKAQDVQEIMWTD